MRTIGFSERARAAVDDSARAMHGGTGAQVSSSDAKQPASAHIPAQRAAAGVPVTKSAKDAVMLDCSAAAGTPSDAQPRSLAVSELSRFFSRQMASFCGAPGSIDNPSSLREPLLSPQASTLAPGLAPEAQPSSSHRAGDAEAAQGRTADSSGSLVVQLPPAQHSAASSWQPGATPRTYDDGGGTHRHLQGSSPFDNAGHLHEDTPPCLSGSQPRSLHEGPAPTFDAALLSAHPQHARHHMRASTSHARRAVGASSPAARMHGRQSALPRILRSAAQDPSRGSWPSVAAQHPGVAAPEWRGGATQRMCVICLEEYHDGDPMKALPCGHRCALAGAL